MQLELLLIFDFLFPTSFYLTQSEYHKNEAVVASKRPIFRLWESGEYRSAAVDNTKTNSRYYCCYYRQYYDPPSRFYFLMFIILDCYSKTQKSTTTATLSSFVSFLHTKNNANLSISISVRSLDVCLIVLITQI